MGLKKLKWYHIITISTLLFTFISCVDKKSKSISQLECLLNVFIDNSPTNRMEYIYVSEAQNWTDTTSVLSFQYSDIPPIDVKASSLSKISSYKKTKIVYTISSFKGNYQKKDLIPCNLEWEKINREDYEPVSESKYLNYTEYELQIVYDFKNKKIVDILKVYPLKKEDFLDKVKNCN